MKTIQFHGRSLKTIKSFPSEVKRETGYQLHRVQQGLDPVHWRPMPDIGQNVGEIRIRAAGQFRVFYMTSFKKTVHVLHAFQKKPRKTERREIKLGQMVLNHLKYLE